MHMSFFTKRERGFLTKCLTQGLSIATNAQAEALTIEPIKEVIAKRYPEENWDDWYREALLVHGSLMALAEYNTCKRLDGWTWYVPRTPDRLHLADNPDEPFTIMPIAHPERLDEHLRVIWDRPRQELMMIIELLTDSGKFKAIEVDSPDKKHVYWRLTWTAGPFHNRNIIYLHRR
ncbi:hypothetical protein BIZ83_gp148 [Erwinia phage vB_EamM_ChrisDB]|uniref:hypothetical protein n=1 Tax=Erwinia phage vB_EamM_ChrisDB TaxID=1883371 RepID=UPI00081C5383|nr:hypothetical protein BIZ83_gp148 [Erwinia phage vB_EamM_ChrisDB]ANZ48705.1 hypothetical protein CHRISDB_143 [Erwinia phage vB_EamM_ChrisDB]